MRSTVTIGRVCFFALILAPVVMLGFSDDDNGPGTPGGGGPPTPLPCWTPTWQQISCVGNCATLWCLCPSRIRCAPTQTGNMTLGPVTQGVTVTCEDWVGPGTGTCTASTRCSGGSLAVPQMGSCGVVVISTQTCLGDCP